MAWHVRRNIGLINERERQNRQVDRNLHLLEDIANFAPESLRSRFIADSKKITVVVRAMAEKNALAPVVARSDKSSVLETPEHDLDPIAPLVAALVVFDGLVPGFATRNAGEIHFACKASRNQSAS